MMNELNFMHENISGIFNYCDRWCEKCSYINRCLLFKQEAEREIKHILWDEDKNDPDLIAKDLADDFKETFAHINNFMCEKDEVFEEFEKDDYEDDFVDEDEDGFFKEEIDKAERPSTFLENSENFLILLSEKLFRDFYKYYDHLRLKMPDDLEENNPQSVLRQYLDTLGWYTPQINVKIRMCYWNKHKLSKAKDPEIAEMDEEMLNVSARIVFVGVENCINALKNLPQQKLESESEIVSLFTMIKQIKEMLINEFPMVLTYKRPYFD